jgi:predicted ABC-type exoprotein transport system permease subunit
MNPERGMEFEAKEAKYLRTIISVGLVLVLVGIVATYIYYGMQFAREAVPSNVAEVPVVETTSTMEAIEAALENAPVASPEEFAAIEAALENAPVAP